MVSEVALNGQDPTLISFRAVQLFHSRSIQLLVAQSFSKNAGLYGERLGALHIPCASAEEAQNVTQQLKVINRREISSASRFGADVVSTTIYEMNATALIDTQMAMIFDDPGLMRVWQADLKGMCRRVTDMRQGLVDLLAKFGTPGDWSHIVQQRGMFA
jgi:aspartate aminotransferase